MRVQTEGVVAGSVEAAPGGPDARSPRPWKLRARVLFVFDPWRGGFLLTVDRVGCAGATGDEAEDGTVRWRTASSSSGTPGVCLVQHVTRGAGSKAYVVNGSEVGAEVPVPTVRHVDGQIIVRANRVPDGERVIVELCDGLVSLAGVWKDRIGGRPMLHISTLKAHTGKLGPVDLHVRVADVR